MDNLNEPIRVLLADDHAVVRAGIRKYLELSKNIRVVAEADDGKQACSLIDREDPDVLVLAVYNKWSKKNR